jgi:hypothetical protein
VRSAKDLPSLHPLWAAAVGAQLIDVLDGVARQGAGLAVWNDPAAPASRIAAWESLLAGYLCARIEQEGPEGSPRGDVLQISAPVLYAMDGGPAAIDEMATAMAAPVGAGEPDDPQAQGMQLTLAAALTRAVEDWLVAGVLEVPPQLAPVPASAETGPACAARDDLESADAGEGHVRLTPLGRHALARLLDAHGWEVPILGACADLDPAALLDGLADYTISDVEVEAAGWLDARGEHWLDALREVALSAAVPDHEGPTRQILLPIVLVTAGERAVPLLAELRREPWLAAPVAFAQSVLGTGREMSPAEQAWMTVDGLGGVDEDDFEECLEGSGLLELLSEPGGVSTAVRCGHPLAGAVLRHAAAYVDDPQVSRNLRKALNGGSGNPAVRAVVVREGRGASGRQTS